MAHGLMSCILRDCLLAVIHSRRGIGITYYILSGNSFEPGAGCSVTSIIDLQMVSVAVHFVSDIGSAGVLDGGSLRHQDIELIVLQRILGRCHNSLIHLHLVASVFREFAMVGIRGISPGLVPHQLEVLLRCIPPEI